MGRKSDKLGRKSDKLGGNCALLGDKIYFMMSLMAKTTQVASDRAFDDTSTVLPAEIARGVYMQNAPSLRALKLMHLMISKAGGRMAEDVRHDMRLSEVRSIKGMTHHDQESLKPLFAELRAATMIYDEPEKKRWSIGGLLDQGMVDYRHEMTGDVLVSWYFGRMFRDMAEESNHWAILDRQTVFHLGSKYSVLLFQHIVSLQNLKHINSKRFAIPELRSVLGIPDGKITRFADLNRRAIQPAIAEINQLSRLVLTATNHKVGRTVAEVEIAWEEKSDLAEAKRELGTAKSGRKARREGSDDKPVIAFPASGSVRYTSPWEEIAKANCNWDAGKIADAFRSFCTGKGIKLDAKSIENIFADFCAKQPRL